MNFSLKTNLLKAGKVLLTALLGSLLAVAANEEVARAFKDIPVVGVILLAAAIAGAEALRNFLKQRYNLPL
jgi:hypothetical protein